MIKIVPTIAENVPRLQTDLEGQVWPEEADSGNWVDHCLQVDSGLDLESLFDSIAHEEVATTEAVGVAPAMAAAPDHPMTPASPASSDSSHHSSCPLPRHKRPSHKRAELKRRGRIKAGLEDLKDEVPSIANKGKLSEPMILSEAADYTKHLKGTCEKNRLEAGNLRQEIESLSREIHTFQEHLPATGLKSGASREKQSSLDQLYQDYTVSNIKTNWKFYLFNFIVKPLFDSYKEEVTTDSQGEFMESCTDWTESSLSLASLRHNIVEPLRSICRETSIMSQPESLPAQALASINQTLTPASQSAPTCHLSELSSFSTSPGTMQEMDPPQAAPSNTGSSVASNIAPARTFSRVSAENSSKLTCLKAKISSAKVDRKMQRAATAHKPTIAVKPSPSLQSPRTNVTISQAHLLARKLTNNVNRSAMPSFSPRNTVPTTVMPKSVPVTVMCAESQRPMYTVHLSRDMANGPIASRSGNMRRVQAVLAPKAVMIPGAVSSVATPRTPVSVVASSVPIQASKSPVCVGPSCAPVLASNFPITISIAASCAANPPVSTVDPNGSVQASMSALPSLSILSSNSPTLVSHSTDVVSSSLSLVSNSPGLVSSSLSLVSNSPSLVSSSSGVVSNCPVSVFAPSASHDPPVSSVARLVTEFDCHDYDFDIADIPIPDLPDTAATSFSAASLGVSSFPVSATCFEAMSPDTVIPNSAQSVNHSNPTFIAQPAFSSIFSQPSVNWS